MADIEIGQVFKSKNKQEAVVVTYADADVVIFSKVTFHDDGSAQIDDYCSAIIRAEFLDDFEALTVKCNGPMTQGKLTSL